MNLSNANIVTNTDQVNFSEFLRPGYLWVDVDLSGAEFTTNDPNEIRDAISTNYDIDLTLALKNATSIELGHYERSPELKYQDEWIITIDKSVLSVPYDLTTVIKVKNDVQTPGASSPNVTTIKSISADSLAKGTTILLKIENAEFNTKNYGKSITRSIENSISKMLNAYIDCTVISPTTVSFRLQGNVQPFDRTLSFILDENATTAGEPIPVSIAITH